MNSLTKYNEYCDLVTRLNSKQEELDKISQQKASLNFEVDTMKRKMRTLEKHIDTSPDGIAEMERMKRRGCSTKTVALRRGGEIGDNPIAEFKKSDAYKNLSKEKKALFKKIEPKLKNSQYSIQDAILIGEDYDDDYDVYKDSVVEDFIDEFMENLEDYDRLSVGKLKEIKEIMYIFVKQVAKNV